MTFCDAFRAWQLHILWLVQFCQSSVIIIFSVQVIHACAQQLDQNNSFCTANLIAVLTAAALSPLFGLSNDWIGIRVNSAICMAALSIISLFMAQFEVQTDVRKLWFMVAIQVFINWTSTTTSYGCARLFGVKCGLYCYAYVKLATLVAACVTVLPLIIYGQCFSSENCEHLLAHILCGLLGCGFVFSLLLNPKPLVQEESSQFTVTSEQYIPNTHALVEF